MNKAFRLGCLVCSLLVLGFIIGCSDDDPAGPPPPNPNPAGTIGVYADVDGTNSNLTDTGGTVTYHVVHIVPEGSVGCSFRIETPTGWTPIAANPRFPVTLGSPESGISCGYGECLSGVVHVMSVMYDSPGSSPPGSVFKVLPHSGTPENIEVVNCNYILLTDGVGMESPVVLP